MIFLLALLISASVLLLARVNNWHLLAFVLPDTGLRPLTLAQVQRSSTPNDALYADHLEVAVDGPAFATTLDLAAARAALLAQATTLGAELREESDTALFFVWRTPTFGFPNGAYVYLSAGAAGTRVALYGRSLYGTYDFGANRAFLTQLARSVTASASGS